MPLVKISIRTDLLKSIQMDDLNIVYLFVEPAENNGHVATFSLPEPASEEVLTIHQLRVYDRNRLSLRSTL